MRIQTVCFILRGKRVLLGKQKDTPTKQFKRGVGYWNGLGGHVEDGETIEAAACREPLEEAKVKVLGLYKAGVMHFHFPDGEYCQVHIFGADGCEGEPQETDEMEPRWFPVDQIPYDQMWPADRRWLPTFLAGKQFVGRVEFGPNKEINSFQLEVIGEN